METQTTDFYPYNHANLVLREGDLAVLRNSQGALCGYCAFAAADVPVEWHGNYDADALQYLQIHGGLTYCNVGGGDQETRTAAVKAANESVMAQEWGDKIMERMAARMDAAKAARLSVPYTHVVFGFDCGHYQDDENYSLRDPQHVLGLARQMREQIAAHAAILPQWRAADRKTRLAMIDEIREKAANKLELGFAGLIGAMSGASEFGDQPISPQTMEGAQS